MAGSSATIAPWQQGAEPRSEGVVRSLVVDGGGAFGEALVRLLSRHGVAAARVHVDQLPAAVERHDPTSVVLLLSACEAHHRLEVVTSLRRHAPAPRVVYVDDTSTAGMTRSDDEQAVHLDLGSHPEELVAAITGSTVPRVAAREGHEPRGGRPGGVLVELTSRELEVLSHIMVGRTNAAVAADLGISPHTVRTHVQNILGKLGVRTRLQAAAVAHRSGVRPPVVDELQRRRRQRQAQGGSRL